MDIRSYNRHTAMLRMSLLLVLVVLLVSYAAPTKAQPALPRSLAAAGDSLTRGVGSGPRYFADNSARSWATGSSPEVNSLALRIATRQPAVEGHVYNLARVGARVGDLFGQVATINTLQPEYVTILIGGNDACAFSERAMTPVATFRSQFADAMDQLATGLPQARVLVLSVPDPLQLWALHRNNRRAVAVWESLGICQSALARARSNAPEDTARRERVRQRVRDYNAELAAICAQYAQCRYDNGAVFSSSPAPEDISPLDYFHLSAQGQARLAELAWAASGLAP